MPTYIVTGIVLTCVFSVWTEHTARVEVQGADEDSAAALALELYRRSAAQQDRYATVCWSGTPTVEETPMRTITPDDLAYGLQEALERAIFPSLELKQRLRHLLTRWDHQRGAADPGAAIVRQWNSDRDDFLKTFAQIDAAGQRAMAEAAVAFHRKFDPRTTLTVEQQLAAWRAQQCAGN